MPALSEGGVVMAGNRRHPTPVDYSDIPSPWRYLAYCTDCGWFGEQWHRDAVADAELLLHKAVYHPTTP